MKSSYSILTSFEEFQEPDKSIAYPGLSLIADSLLNIVRSGFPIIRKVLFCRRQLPKLPEYREVEAYP